jgi:PAS domain S-box-containing protein
LLPPGKFPRLAVAVALLLPLGLFLDLEFVRSAVANLFVSNTLDFAMTLFAAVCCFVVARRSSGYPRQIWLLLALALTLESLAQAISTYYQTFVPNASHSPWPSDVLYFVWPAPVFMIFLPRSDDDSSAIDSLRLLDFLQVAIIAVTIYLYFFYSPSRWESNQPGVLRQILILYILRDFVLSFFFFARSRRPTPSWLRSFSLILALVFLTAVLSDADYLVTLGTGAASWGDLVEMLPYFIVVLLAASWKSPEPDPAPISTSSPLSTLVVTQVLPIAIPLLVIVMGRAIAREQLFLAWLAVAASVACSSVRLILTNRRQRQVTENLLTTEKALRLSEHMLSTAFRSSPDAFSINPFPNGPYLEVNEGFTRLTGYTREETLNKTPRQMNLWVNPSERDAVLAALIQTGSVRDVEFQYRTKSGEMRFGQMYASLISLEGQRYSLVVVRDITQRKQTEDILRSSEQRFRSLVSDLHYAVVLHLPNARVEFANRAAYRMFHLPEGSALGKQLPELGISIVDEDGKDMPDSDRPVLRVVRTGIPIHDTLLGFRYPGSDNILWAFGSVVPQFDARGNIIRLIASFADVTELKNAERAIHQLSTQLVRLQDEERRRIGRELHDGLAQTVLAINLSLAQVRQSLSSEEHAAARSLERARALTQQMSREIRTLSYLLHPPLLDDLGLVSALKEYTHGFSERSGIDTQLIVTPYFDRLPQPVELAFFRIIQESLANIQRHSASSTAQICLRQENSQIILEVIDSGRGFTTGHREGTVSVNPELRGAVPKNAGNSGVLTPEASDRKNSLPSNGNPQPQQVRLGVGIPGMRERMSQIGGRLDIISGPTGTTVRAIISLPQVSPPTEVADDASSHPDRG